jgi:hypothetical protein
MAVAEKKDFYTAFAVSLVTSPLAVSMASYGYK